MHHKKTALLKVINHAMFTCKFYYSSLYIIIKKTYVRTNL